MNWQAANAIARTIPMLYTREEKKRQVSAMLKILKEILTCKKNTP